MRPHKTTTVLLSVLIATAMPRNVLNKSENSQQRHKSLHILDFQVQHINSNICAGSISYQIQKAMKKKSQQIIIQECIYINDDMM